MSKSSLSGRHLSGSRLSGLCLFGFALSACSGDPTFYALQTRPGTGGAIVPGGPSVVEVRTPAVSERLDRDRIVLADSGYRLTLASGASWSEPLSALIGQTLAGDLALRLPSATVFAQNNAVTATPRVYVEVTIRDFEADSSGHALVAASLSVKAAPARQADQAERSGAAVSPVATASPAAESFVWHSPEPVGADAARLAAALSDGLSALADRAAERIRALPPV